MSIADKLTTIAENQKKVYDSGFAAGQEQGGGYDDGFADGKQAQYDSFWDVFQQKGNRDFYDRAFESVYWSDENFAPRYPLICTGSNGCRQMFSANTLLTTVKVPIYARDTRLTHTFNGCTNLKTIPLLFVENVAEYTNAFNQCKALEDITVDGEIGANISFEHSTKLTKASIEGIVAALSDTAAGKTLTLSQTAVDNAFYDPEGEDVPGTDTMWWADLVSSKPNWTITLV